ncbi:MAG: hypothetical protein D6748_07145 [Calditrichaeota bacterium]|nr:MAG: hypothetical protein D6748_07145 [Calditrichota bacterium]
MLNKNKRIKEIIVIRGILENISPLSVGSGEDEHSDHDIIRSWDGEPFIPGTTIAGILRHALLSEKDADKGYKYKIKKLFGEEAGENNSSEEESEKTGHSGKIVQSSVLTYDLFPVKNSVWQSRIRDGVRIDPDYRTAVDASKYDFEVLEPGVRFDFKLEFHLRKKGDEDYYRIIRHIINLLKSGHLHLGAKSSRGMGRVKLVEESVFRFDMEKKEDILAFIEGPDSWSNYRDDEIALTEDSFENKIILNAHFRIPYSLIIRSYNLEPDSPDASHIKSAGKDVIPGTSWAGSIRHGLYNILEELGVDKDRRDAILEDIFGTVDEETRESRASAIRIYESEIKKGKRLVYTRNKVDRFTGGVVETALFDEEPVYEGETDLVIDLSGLVIKSKDKYEGYLGLLLLALRDIGNGIQPVGGDANIGRGILELTSITLNGEKVEINNDQLPYYQEAAKVLN